MADLSSSLFSPSGQYDVGALGSRVGNIYKAPQAVTQGTSVSTGVTINGTQGVITMFAGTIAAASTATFTVTNSAVKSGDSVQTNVVNFAGTYATNGFPVATANNVVDGAFDVKVSNVHASNATGANAIKVGFCVN